MADRNRLDRVRGMVEALTPGYFALVMASGIISLGLKLVGYKANHPALERARKKILEMGGVTKVNTFTKIYLCFLGQYD